MTVLIPGVATLPQSALMTNIAKALSFGQTAATNGAVLRAQQEAAAHAAQIQQLVIQSGAGIGAVAPQIVVPQLIVPQATAVHGGIAQIQNLVAGLTGRPQLPAMPTTLIASGIHAPSVSAMTHGSGVSQIANLVNIARGTPGGVPLIGSLPGIVPMHSPSALLGTGLPAQASTLIARGIEAPMLPQISTTLIDRARAAAVAGGQLQHLVGGLQAAAPTVTTSLVGRLSTAAAGGTASLIDTAKIAATVQNISGAATRLAERV